VLINRVSDWMISCKSNWT